MDQISAERQSSPNAAETVRWQRSQRLMNRCVCPRNEERRFVGSDFVRRHAFLHSVQSPSLPLSALDELSAPLWSECE